MMACVERRVAASVGIASPRIMRWSPTRRAPSAKSACVMGNLSGSDSPEPWGCCLSRSETKDHARNAPRSTTPEPFARADQKSRWAMTEWNREQQRAARASDLASNHSMMRNRQSLSRTCIRDEARAQRWETIRREERNERARRRAMGRNNSSSEAIARYWPALFVWLENQTNEHAPAIPTRLEQAKRQRKMFVKMPFFRAPPSS